MMSTDAGVDAGRDAGRSDAGSDAGYDAGTRDAGCPCPGRDGGGCAIPADFPPNQPQFIIEEVCDCIYISAFVCYDETDLRCPSWTCYPGRVRDGGSGVELTEDGGFNCYC